MSTSVHIKQENLSSEKIQSNSRFTPQDKTELSGKVKQIQTKFREEFANASNGKGRLHLKKVLRGWTLPWIDLEIPESVSLKDPLDKDGKLVIENKNIQDVICVAEKVRSQKCEVWVNLGIGGSDLTTQAIVWSTLSTHHNFLPREARGGAPEIHFIGNDFSPEKVSDLLEGLDKRGLLQKTKFNVISKSGSTQETLAAFLIVRDFLQKRLNLKSGVGQFFVATTGLNEKSLLFQLNKIDPFYAMLSVPDGTGGRFSAFSPVGLLALAVTANEKLGESPRSRVMDAMSGIKDAISDMLDNPADNEKNVVFQSAMNQVIAEVKKKKTFLIMIVYDPLLKQVGDLAQQLYSESVQKFGQGMDFVSIVGSEKMHSIWNGAAEGTGAMRDLVLFVGTQKTAAGRDSVIPHGSAIKGKEIESMEGLPLSKVQQASMEGVMRDATERGILNYTIVIPERTVREVARFIYLFQSIVAVEGKLRGLEKEQFVDGTYKDFTYLQDGVEGYKIQTREILMSSRKKRE
ncbi:MAG: hypothetical protein HZC17_03540 [Candidatus Omnitrophica bacterium]|nr:hypothetical protein [Candidatus Omnitrophota bacterium]